MISQMKVDGGASANNLLMQMQSDFSHIEIQRSTNAEATAAGAAYLAGIAVGFYASREELKAKLGAGKSFYPQMDEETRTACMKGWHRAIKACQAFAESEE